MGYELMRRVKVDERIYRVPKAYRMLAVILADHAYDSDEQPCCWVSPAALTLELEGTYSKAALRRFERSLDALIEAGLARRAKVPHEGRPKSRKCPRDGRRFHVELFPIVDVTRQLSDGEIVDVSQRLSDTENVEIVDVARQLNPESSRRGAVKVVDVGRRLHRGTTENPPSKENPAPELRSTDGDSSNPETDKHAVGLSVESTSQLQKSTTVRAREGMDEGFGKQDQKRLNEPAEPRCAKQDCRVAQSRHNQWMQELDPDKRHPFITQAPTKPKRRRRRKARQA